MGINNVRYLVTVIILFLSSICYCQVIDTQFGKAEVLGLKHLKLQELLDLLSVKAPEISVDKCASTLKKIGFPDASIMRYYDEDGKFYSVVTIIEREYSKFVKYKNPLQYTLSTKKQWGKAIGIYNNNPIEFQIGLLKYKSDIVETNFDKQKILKDLNKKVVIELWNFLKNRDRERDKDMAIWILNNDGNYLNRIIASMILINFPESDLVWWSLIDALRDPVGRVCSTSELVLKYFISNNRRKINWQPAVKSLNYLINGTNPFVFSTILKIISETDVSENIIKYLFRESKGYLVLSYLKAQHEKERAIAYDFLKKIFKKDFGNNVEKWEKYIINFVK